MAGSLVTSLTLRFRFCTGTLSYRHCSYLVTQIISSLSCPNGPASFNCSGTCPISKPGRCGFGGLIRYAICDSSGLVQEAESGALSGNFAIGNDMASVGQYVAAPRARQLLERTCFSTPCRYCFNVPTTVSIACVRVAGFDQLSDSFYVRSMVPGRVYLWDVLINSTMLTTMSATALLSIQWRYR